MIEVPFPGVRPLVIFRHGVLLGAKVCCEKEEKRSEVYKRKGECVMNERGRIAAESSDHTNRHFSTHYVYKYVHIVDLRPPPAGQTEYGVFEGLHIGSL